MATSLEPFITKLNSFAELADAEITYLAQVDARISAVARHTQLIDEGDRKDSLYLLLSGWACRYKILESGRRQIIDFQLPGDFVGMRGIYAPISDVSFSTLTACRIWSISHRQFRDVFESQPRVAFAFLGAMARDKAIVIEHLVNLGRRTAQERMAHFMLETLYRLRRVGIASDGEFECPVTQDELADALGLSSVHVNRVLRTLRERGLMTFQQGRVAIHDAERLALIAGFDPLYLDPPQPDP